ncbi:hypothetical protein C8R44DRAFT_866938 [Mycena epipterygia]|nr:hypothetical protein C8R44DRAFT_866938 [Mycena epipterygia]
MFFHNAATHRHSRVPSAVKLAWEPFHMASFFRTAAAVGETERYHELYKDSEPLPRPPRGRADTVYFQLPSSGGDDTTCYVLSWPPSLGTPSLCSPSSASSSASDSSFVSVYYTPPTTPASSSPTSTLSTPPNRKPKVLVDALDFIDLTDDENFPPLLTKFLHAKPPTYRPAGYRRRSVQPGEPGLKGWARLRRNAPSALRMAPIEREVARNKPRYILEFDDEDRLVKPQADLALIRRENTPDQRRRLLDLLMNLS